MKLCIVTCYNQPDYVRALTLRSAAAAIGTVEVIVVKNEHKGILRYAEVLVRLLNARLQQKPDAYLLTFRGYEMLLPVRLLTIGKPLVYDEFVNPIEWAVYEHGKLQRDSPLTWLFTRMYALLLIPVDLILTDTDSHAELSASMLKIAPKKFLSVPVGTDEAIFNGGDSEEPASDVFTVLYYGNMLPLHGLKYVIDAAVELQHEPVRFVLVGGGVNTEQDVERAAKNGAKINYRPWVEFAKLPALMQAADVCLAGPFGDTFQAQYVITGKAYQYLAMGRPTIVGQNKESGVFRDKHDVLIVPQGDAKSLAETIRWAMNNGDALRRIGLNGQKLFSEKFSNQRLAERLESGLVGLGLLEASTSPEQKQHDK